MSQLSNDTKLSMLWIKFDFHSQVDLFMELPMHIFLYLLFIVFPQKVKISKRFNNNLNSSNDQFISSNSLLVSVF